MRQTFPRRVILSAVATPVAWLQVELLGAAPKARGESRVGSRRAPLAPREILRSHAVGVLLRPNGFRLADPLCGSASLKMTRGERTLRMRSGAGAKVSQSTLGCHPIPPKTAVFDKTAVLLCLRRRSAVSRFTDNFHRFHQSFCRFSRILLNCLQLRPTSTTKIY